jgi:hypothetical protein
MRVHRVKLNLRLPSSGLSHAKVNEGRAKRARGSGGFPRERRLESEQE